MELNCRFVAHQDDGGVAFEQEFHQRPHDYSNLLIFGHYFIIKITFDNLIVFADLTVVPSSDFKTPINNATVKILKIETIPSRQFSTV